MKKLIISLTIALTLAAIPLATLADDVPQPTFQSYLPPNPQPQPVTAIIRLKAAPAQRMPPKTVVRRHRPDGPTQIVCSNLTAVAIHGPTYFSGCTSVRIERHHPAS